MVYCTKRWNWETDIQLLGIKKYAFIEPCELNGLQTE